MAVERKGRNAKQFCRKATKGSLLPAALYSPRFSFLPSLTLRWTLSTTSVSYSVCLKFEYLFFEVMGREDIYIK